MALIEIVEGLLKPCPVPRDGGRRLPIFRRGVLCVEMTLAFNLRTGAQAGELSDDPMQSTTLI